MKTIRITQRQLDTLTAVQRHIAAHGHAPTVRELAMALGLRSIATVQARLGDLRRAGVLVDAPKHSIGTTVPKPGVQVLVMHE